MNKKLERILEKPLYVYLVIVFYLVYRFSFNPFSFDLLTVAEYLIFCFGTSLLLQLLLKGLRFRYSAIVLSAFWVMFLFNGYVTTIIQFITGNAFSKSLYPYIWLAGILASLGLAYISNRFQRYHTTVNKITNVFLLIAIVVVLSNTWFIYARTKKATDLAFKHNQPSPETTKDKKDIVWILMDEYGSSASLKNKFNFDNPLDTFLSGKGFYVFKDLRSRSDKTLYSLNSIFNFDDTLVPYAFAYGRYSLQNSAWPKVLAMEGYRFNNLSFFDIGDKVPAYKAIYYDQTFRMGLLEGTAFSYLLQRYFKKTYRAIVTLPEGSFPFPLAKYNEYVVSLFDKQSRIDSAAHVPACTWLHLLIPHGPDYRFPKFIKKDPNQADSITVKQVYIDHLTYGNQVLENFLNTHPQLKNKIVIISGDHGCRTESLGKGIHTTQPFCAVYLPTGTDSSGLRSLHYLSQLPSFLLQRAN
jgi:hypothetical protein